MPNWTFCKLKASPKVLKKYVVENNNEREKNRIPYVFDFNLVIPQVEAYNDPDLISGGDEDFAIYWYLSREGKYSYDKIPLPKNVLERYFNYFSYDHVIYNKFYPETPEESKALYERGSKYVYLADTYGYRDWYDWRRANWGTKWNACETNVQKIDIGVITFETAWAPPIPIIKKIFYDNPDNRIGFYWTNEDWDGYHHIIHYKNGKWATLNYDEYTFFN